jgi:hypothetical protein
VTVLRWQISSEWETGWKTEEGGARLGELDGENLTAVDYAIGEGREDPHQGYGTP